jgi:hypothetical protein
LVEFTGIFLPLSFDWEVEQNYWLLVPLLAGRGRCPPEYGSNDVNQIKSSLLLVGPNEWQDLEQQDTMSIAVHAKQCTRTIRCARNDNKYFKCMANTKHRNIRLGIST